NLFRFVEVIANVGLRANPVDVALDPFFELNLRLVASCANFRGVAREMPHLAGTKLAAYFRFNVDLEQARKDLRDLTDRRSLAAADVDCLALELVRLRGEQIRARDVFNKREIARLFAIFVEDGRQIVEQARAENCDHAGVGIKNRLARSVGERVPERDRWDSNLFSPEQYKFFLIDLGQTVNRFAANRRAFRGRHALGDGPADRAMHFPVATAELFDRSHRWKNKVVFRTTTGAFAVNGLRAGHDNLF